MSDTKLIFNRQYSATNDYDGCPNCQSRMRKYCEQNGSMKLLVCKQCGYIKGTGIANDLV